MTRMESGPSWKLRPIYSTTEPVPCGCRKRLRCDFCGKGFQCWRQVLDARWSKALGLRRPDARQVRLDWPCFRAFEAREVEGGFTAAKRKVRRVALLRNVQKRRRIVQARTRWLAKAKRELHDAERTLAKVAK